jgi:hypothetical protein
MQVLIRIYSSSKGDANLRLTVYRPSTLHIERPGPPWLHFEPLKLMNFDFNMDLDQAFTLMQIWIRNFERNSASLLKKHRIS